jgi:hypothetical protein
MSRQASVHRRRPALHLFSERDEDRVEDAMPHVSGLPLHQLRTAAFTLALAALVAAGTVGCKPARSSAGPRQAAYETSGEAEPHAVSPSEILDLDPQPDLEAARLWRRLADGERGSLRAELAARYEAQRYRAAAEFVRAAGAAEKGAPTGQWLPVLMQATLGPDVLRGCKRYDENVVVPVVSRMVNLTAEDHYLEARQIGIEAMEQFGRVCPLVVETAFATIGAAASRKTVSDEELELALRTIVTADIEMNLSPAQGEGMTVYQYAALHLLDRGDPASAVVAAELGLAHQKKQQQGLVAPSQLQAVAGQAWTALRVRK